MHLVKTNWKMNTTFNGTFTVTVYTYIPRIKFKSRKLQQPKNGLVWGGLWCLCWDTEAAIGINHCKIGKMEIHYTVLTDFCGLESLRYCRKKTFQSASSRHFSINLLSAKSYWWWTDPQRRNEIHCNRLWIDSHKHILE